MLHGGKSHPLKGTPGEKKDFLPNIRYLARLVLFKSDLSCDVIEYHILNTNIMLEENLFICLLSFYH